jgi:cellulose synthase (UDP-forming)
MLSWLWGGIAGSNGFPFKLLRLLLLIAGLAWGVLFITLPLTWRGQTVLGLLMVFAGMMIGRISRSVMVTMTLMVFSMFATVRYAWWRVGAAVAYFQDPSNKWDWVDAMCIVILLSAEAYAFSILFLGFMQTIWPLHRPPVPLPQDENEWPHIDLLIPTYNEPLSVVRYTAMASMNVDWPADKLHIYILDDGKRETFRRFAQDAGVGYMTRDDNAHAKAGNINRALDKLHSPYVAIFDCDHLPTRSFLQVTMGWFLREQKLAMVQTPHHFYSADPFERNLKQFRLIPNEGELFYGVVQDGNDFWNATFFCGSCAVLRRTALDEIGGIAVETVTEDAHTSLRMQMRGWNTAYINIPQAAGLATERLSGHIQQRVRWARGMIQILRTDNPLFVKGLKLAQRICYFNAMTHFLYAVPRLIFLTAPLVYLFFSRSNVPGYWAAILAYAMPHLVLSNVTNSRIQGEHRHSFWNEIYETVLSPYILLPTLVALINPKLGTFNVTAKGGFVEETYFDGKIATPFVVLMFLNLAGLLMAIPRLFHVPGMTFFWDGTHPGTIAMNTLWCTFNLMILGVAITVAREEIQRREQVRIDFAMPARVRFSNGSEVAGQTLDISIGGTALRIRESFPFAIGEWITLLLPIRVGDAELPATIVGNEGGMLRLQFEALSLLEEEMLTTILYSRADAWLNWGETREEDRPLRSLYRIMKLSIRGMWATLSMLKTRRAVPAKAGASKARGLASRVVPLLICVIALGGVCRPAHAKLHTKPSAAAVVHAEAFTTQLSLRDLGATQDIEIHGTDGYHAVPLVLPRDLIVDHASMHLIYRFSPEAMATGRLKVSLNGSVFATLQPSPDRDQEVIDQVLSLPAELLVRKNELTFEFVGRPATRCDERSTTDLWTRIDPGSLLTISGQRLPLAATLQQLPLPFLDSEITWKRIIPFVLARTPSAVELRAAGVVASYFGMVADYPVPRFPVSLAVLPHGNVVVVAEASSDLVTQLSLGPVTGPVVALRVNPSDPFGKVLIVTGQDDSQVLVAAQALATHSVSIQGTSMTLQDFELPSPRTADDAPRWATLQKKASLWSTAAGTSRDSDATMPVQIFLRVPPDLYAADKLSVNLHLDYHYNATGIAPGSALLLQSNGSAVGSLPLRQGNVQAQANVPLPVVSLRPFSNSISAQWSLAQKPSKHCAASVPVNFSGSIEGSSYLDLHGLSHWAAMPNLELFSNAGFPFTRFADLSQTMIVLPDQPSAQAIELYLTLLGHFSAETGYPALRIAVGHAAEMRAGADTDFLVIGTGPDDPGISQLIEQMPLRLDGQSLVIRQTSDWISSLRVGWQRFRERFGNVPEQRDLQTLSGAIPDALIEGFESPYAPQRSVVVIEVKDDTSYGPFLSAFLDAIHSSAISGDVAAFQAGTFQSFHAGNSAYSLGERPWLTWLKVSLINGPWYMVIGLVIFSLLSAARMQARCRQLSKARLHLEEATT